MSRICVKSLPKYVAEDRLREYFSQKGEITDVKLMRTKDGKSRQFAFIGFRTEHEAEEAIKYFNKSYIDTSRITCEVARKVGDPNMPRPWSRHSLKKEEKKSNDEKKLADKKKSKALGCNGEEKNLKKDADDDDPQLQEFLQVMKPRVNSKLWENDMLITSKAETDANASEKQSVSKERKEKSVPHQVELDQNDKVGNELNDSNDAKEPDDVVHNEVVSDMDYFKSRVRKEWSDSDDETENDHDDDEDEDEDSEGDDGDGDGTDEHQEKGNYDDKLSKVKLGSDFDQKVQVKCKNKALDDDASLEKNEEGPSCDSGDEELEEGKSLSTREDEKGVIDSCRLFVRNLPYTATEEDLEDHFSKYGSVSQVHIVLDKDTKRSKGIAYILYTLPESAVRALEELDKSIFQGRLLHLMPAIQRSSNNQLIDGFPSQDDKTFKRQRVEGRKASEASGNTRAWNSLFMRSDTVVENIARKYGISKGDLLDREADDLAVHIALGETQVIAETKSALSNAGVNVESLDEFASGKNNSMKRSNHVLLVKNLPYGSSENELAKMFGKFGSLDKVILPPTKTVALVVFLEPTEARAAFRGLAYKRYKDAPLYLEWAPGNILSKTSSVKTDNKGKATGERESVGLKPEEHAEVMTDMDNDLDRIESRSLFVKNLNFKTTEDSLKMHLTEQMKEGRILSVRVKKHLKDGKLVSMGFGFIEFDSVETTSNVCRDLQGTVLDGHALILQICHSKNSEQVPRAARKDGSSTKILVRNVAFEATKKDLRQLFSPFGQIKSLRLPVKFGNHRGFAFVEYITKQEATNALKALSNTHLYGRHLVLERAKEGETLEELRARTASQFTHEENGFQNAANISKKRKNVSALNEGEMMFKRTAV